MIPRIRFIWKPISVKPKKNALYVIRDYDGKVGFAKWVDDQWMDAELDEFIAWWPIPPAGKIATR